MILADELEERSQVIMVVQAGDWKRLAKITIQAIDSVESVTDDISLLPAKNEASAYVSLVNAQPRTRRSVRN